MTATRTIRIAATIGLDNRRADSFREAEIHGEHFGVFQIGERLWNVTHVPTGYLVTHAGKKADALEFVKRIAPLTDWSSTDVEAITEAIGPVFREVSEGLCLFRDIYALSTGVGL